MTRLAHALIAATYAMCAVVIAAALIRLLGASASAAWVFAGVLAMTIGQFHAFVAGRAERARMAHELIAMTKAHNELAVESGAILERLGGLEARIESETGERHATLVSEVRTLEGLVLDMGKRMRARIADARREGAGVADPATVDRAGMLSAVRDALEAGRVDLHLQPVVSLPQRKTYFYESYSRLRDENGEIIMPSAWLGVAEAAGLVGAVDNLLLFRCVQIVRRLAERERRVGIFCNISADSLSDDNFFPQFLDFLRRNADLAGSLIFEIGQTAFSERSHVVARNMARLADFGFRFSIDKVEDLDLDFADLQRAGVKFLKIPGDTLVAALRPGAPLGISAAPELMAEDYAGLLARYGVELIAEKVEEETTVIEVLDRDVAFAQGHLFGAPRPIREDILGDADTQTAAPAMRLAG